MTRKIKVLLLLHDLSPTGAPKVAAAAFTHLKDSVELRTISYEGGPLGERLRTLGPVQTLVSYRWPGMPASPRAVLLFLWHRAFSVAKARRWSRAVVRWQPDVVYINSIAGLLARKRLRLPPTPTVLHVHELDSFLRPLASHLPQMFREMPNRYLAVSEAVREALTDRYGIDPAKVAVIPAFTEPFPLPPPRPVPADGRLVVGGSGVISWVKGAQLWLLMAAELKARLGADRVRFVWVGVPDNDEGWQFGAMVRKLDLTGDVTLVPFVANPQEYYAQLDVFALTSWEETASLALLENMLLERAVVCFAGSGGPKEFAGDAGVVVPNFSPTEMADAVAALCADPARRRALGQAARQRVLTHFTPDVLAPRILGELRRLAQMPPRPNFGEPE